MRGRLVKLQALTNSIAREMMKLDSISVPPSSLLLQQLESHHQCVKYIWTSKFSQADPVFGIWLLSTEDSRLLSEPSLAYKSETVSPAKASTPTANLTAHSTVDNKTTHPFQLVHIFCRLPTLCTHMHKRVLILNLNRDINILTPVLGVDRNHSCLELLSRRGGI